MTTPHTSGKLQAIHGSHLTVVGTNEYIGRCGDHGPHKENARRIAASWNACDGIPTDALERGKIMNFEVFGNSIAGSQPYNIRELMQQVDQFRALAKANAESLVAALSHRNELLDTIHAIKSAAGNPEQVYELARKAIIKHDPQSDTARLEAHRKLHNIMPPPSNHGASRIALINAQVALGQAIHHLQRILNKSRTATESWNAEQAAREWLESIGSEPT